MRSCAKKKKRKLWCLTNFLEFSLRLNAQKTITKNCFTWSRFSWDHVTFKSVVSSWKRFLELYTRVCQNSELLEPYSFCSCDYTWSPPVSFISRMGIKLKWNQTLFENFSSLLRNSATNPLCMDVNVRVMIYFCFLLFWCRCRCKFSHSLQRQCCSSCQLLLCHTECQKWSWHHYVSVPGRYG